MAEQPTAYVTELETYDGGEYLEIPLPEEIEDYAELAEALEQLRRIEEDDSDESKMDAFFLSVESPPRRDLPRFIQVDLEFTETRHKQVVKTADAESDPPYRLTIPEAFRHEASNRPLAGFEEDDDVTLEVDTDSDHMRIYDPEDYRLRDVELLMNGRKPVYKKLTVAGVVGSLAEDSDDGPSVRYPDQQFRIIPFDANDDLFPEQAAVQDERTVDPELLDKVIEQDRLPRCTADQLAIMWDEEGDGYKTFRQCSDVEEVSVRLPEKGSFWIEWTNTSKRMDATGGVGLDYGSPQKDKILIGNNWYGLYHTDPDDSDEFIVYVPYRSY